MIRILVIAWVCSAAVTASAQVIMTEDFAIADQSLLSDHGWIAHSSSGSNAVTVGVSSGLTFSGYSGSGIGNAALLDNIGEDVSRLFTTVPSGTIYVSFLVRASATQPGYFLHLGASSTTFAARVFVQAGSVPGSVNFGISNSSTASFAPIPTNVALDSTCLVIVKYDVSASGNASIWVINGVVPATEAAAGAPEHSVSGSGQVNIDRVCLRQYHASQSISVDAIRVGRTWSDAPLPVQLSSFAVKATAAGAMLTWQTASEVDNAGFEVERRTIANGELANANYQKVGFVAGAGTSTSPREYSFTDAPGPGRYAYRLKQIDRNGAATYHGEAEIEVGTAPRAISLGDNYPNPFNPATTIEFSVEAEGPATLIIYDMTGREVATLFDGVAKAGFVNRVMFEARTLASGTYIYRLQAAGSVMTKRMMLVK